MAWTGSTRRPSRNGSASPSCDSSPRGQRHSRAAISISTQTASAWRRWCAGSKTSRTPWPAAAPPMRPRPRSRPPPGSRPCSKRRWRRTPSAEKWTMAAGCARQLKMCVRPRPPGRALAPYQTRHGVRCPNAFSVRAGESATSLGRRRQEGRDRREGLVGQQGQEGLVGQEGLEGQDKSALKFRSALPSPPDLPLLPVS